MIDLAKISHGHVVKNRRETLSRCGGPPMCSHCQLEAEVVELQKMLEKWVAAVTDEQIEALRKSDGLPAKGETHE